MKPSKLKFSKPFWSLSQRGYSAGTKSVTGAALTVRSNAITS